MPEESTPSTGAPAEPVPDGAAPDDTAPDDTAAADSATSDSATSDSDAPEGAARTGAAPEGAAAPGAAAPGAAPTGAASGDAATPPGAAPTGAASGDAPTGPPPVDAPPATPQQPMGFFDGLRRLPIRRPKEGRWLGGVCAGLARRTGLDPVIVRAAVIVLSFVGAGVLLYLGAWLLLPDDPGEIPLERAVRQGDPSSIGLLVLAAIAALTTPFFIDENGAWLWFVVVPVVVVVWFAVRRGSSPPWARPQPVASHPGPGRAPGAPDPTWAVPYQTAGQGSGAQQAAPPAPQDAPGYPAGTYPTASYPPATHQPGSYPPPASPSPSYPTAGAPVPPGTPPGPPTAYQPPWPPPPARPRRSRIPGGVALLVVGTAVVAYGLAVLAFDRFDWAGHSWVYGTAAALGVLAVGTLAAGLSGRRSGGLGFLTSVVALATVLASAASSINIPDGIGSERWTPTGRGSVTQHQPYRLGAGVATLDLGTYREVGAPGGVAPRVDAVLGGGLMRILVPRDLTVEVRVSTQSGQLVVRDNGEVVRDEGLSDETAVVTVGDGTTPELVVTARNRFGVIEIVREQP